MPQSVSVPINVETPRLSYVSFTNFTGGDGTVPHDDELFRGTVVAQVLVWAMRKTVTAATTFTPGERDYIRRELDMFFSTYPTVVEGFQLKTWRGGPQAGQPKLPPPAHSLLDRGADAARYRIAPAAPILHRCGADRTTRDDGGLPSRRSCEVRPHQARTRHRPGLKAARRRRPQPARSQR